MKNRKRRLASLLFSAILTTITVLDPVYASGSYPPEVYETETYDHEYGSEELLIVESLEEQTGTDPQEAVNSAYEFH